MKVSESGEAQNRVKSEQRVVVDGESACNPERRPRDGAERDLKES